MEERKINDIQWSFTIHLRFFSPFNIFFSESFDDENSPLYFRLCAFAIHLNQQTYRNVNADLRIHGHITLLNNPCLINWSTAWWMWWFIVLSIVKAASRKTPLGLRLFLPAHLPASLLFNGWNHSFGNF